MAGPGKQSGQHNPAEDGKSAMRNRAVGVVEVLHASEPHSGDKDQHRSQQPRDATSGLAVGSYTARITATPAAVTAESHQGMGRVAREAA